ncbi:ATP-grasp domain-containing protein [Hyalangium versicolor]|uniref:ATP-grasp domain-containing protein n=1 Tax=Hyalangium versicolor TaxID=2861190 RepID=UPI001CCC0B0A|nr:carboxylate--amine ligase [Hyalangium versicolor]
MNVVFISPHFPHHFIHFVTALRERGVNVLGIGDAPYDALRHELKNALTEYFFVPHLDDKEAMLRAVGYFTWRNGRIDRIDSLNESWLEVEAQLREDFHVPGLRPADLRSLRSKLGMHDLFKQAGIAHPDAIAATDAATVKAFGQRVGYPLVLKPDVGVGAAHTFTVKSDAEVDAAFSQPLPNYAAQKYVKGTIVTYDGMVDRQGKVICAFSHEYSNGIMESVLEQRELVIWSLRDLPPALDELGRRTVEALGLRERWFHLEFFRLEDGSYAALEANLRPPGSVLPDMMNYACDIDVYRLWARMLTGEQVDNFQYTRKYYVCHTSRRSGRAYKHPHSQVVSRLGSALLEHRELPAVFHSALGNEIYLSRHQDLDAMREAISFIQAPA